MNPISLKDLILYFLTANVCFFISMNLDNEKTTASLGIVLFALLIAFLMRMNHNEEAF